MRAACQTLGFFHVRGHGIDPTLLRAALDECKAFFALPLSAKHAVTGLDPSYGYQSLGTEQLDHSGQQRAPCTQEGFRLKLTPPLPSHPWPSPASLPSFRATLEAYHAAMESVAHRLMQLLVASIGLPPDYLQASFQPHAAATTRLLHYAPVVSRPENGVFGCGAHTDWGCLTLLVTEEEGLEVLGEDRQWLQVPPSRQKGEEEEWLLICNLGDLLQRWTNDALRSSRHRVVNRGGLDRYSIPFFFSVHPEAVVACLPPFLEEGQGQGKYPPIVAREYIMEKYRSVSVGSLGKKGAEGWNGGKSAICCT